MKMMVRLNSGIPILESHSKIAGPAVLEERQMIRKSFIILPIFVGIMLLSVVGCGSDAEGPADSMVQPPVSSLSNEELLGSWKVVSIFGMTPESYLQSLSEEGIVEEKVKQFDLRFDGDNSWICNFTSETALISPDGPSGTSKLKGVWSGTYTFNSLTLSLMLKGSEVQLTPKPDDLFQEEFGLTLSEAEQVYDESFSSDFLQPFMKSTWTKQAAGTLILRTPAGEKMVLAKK